MMRAPQPSSVAPVAFASRAASRSGAWRAGRPYAWPRSQISSSRTASSGPPRTSAPATRSCRPSGGWLRSARARWSLPAPEARDRRRHGGRPDASGVRGTAVDGRVEQPVGSRADRGSRDSGRVQRSPLRRTPRGSSASTPRPLCRFGMRAPPGRASPSRASSPASIRPFAAEPVSSTSASARIPAIRCSRRS